MLSMTSGQSHCFEFWFPKAIEVAQFAMHMNIFESGMYVFVTVEYDYYVNNNENHLSTRFCFPCSLLKKKKPVYLATIQIEKVQY